MREDSEGLAAECSGKPLLPHGTQQTLSSSNPLNAAYRYLNHSNASNPIQTEPWYLLLHAHYLGVGRSLEAGAPSGGVWLPAGASGAAKAQDSKGSARV